jgi:hypothetical protein
MLLIEKALEVGKTEKNSDLPPFVESLGSFFFGTIFTIFGFCWFQKIINLQNEPYNSIYEFGFSMMILCFIAGVAFTIWGSSKFVEYKQNETEERKRREIRTRFNREISV